MVVIWALLSLLACGGFTPDPSATDTSEPGDTVKDTVPDPTDTGDTVPPDTDEPPVDTPDPVVTPDPVDTDTDTFVWDTSVPQSTPTPTPGPNPTPTPTPSTMDLRDGIWTGVMRFRVVNPVLPDSVCEGPLNLVLDEGANTQVTGSLNCNWLFSLGAPHQINGWGRVSVEITGRYNLNDPNKINGNVTLNDTTGGFTRVPNFIGTMTGDQLRFVFNDVVLGTGETANFVLDRF